MPQSLRHARFLNTCERLNSLFSLATELTAAAGINDTGERVIVDTMYRYHDEAMRSWLKLTEGERHAIREWDEWTLMLLSAVAMEYIMPREINRISMDAVVRISEWAPPEHFVADKDTCMGHTAVTFEGMAYPVFSCMGAHQNG